MSSSTRASTASSSSARLRAAHGCCASVSTRYVRQLSTNTGRSHVVPAVAFARRRSAASFSSAAATHILTAGSTSASSARSIVALSSSLLLLLLPPASPSPSPSSSPSASAVYSERIARRSWACVSSACGDVREVSAGLSETRRSARPCAAIASKKTVYDAAVVLEHIVIREFGRRRECEGARHTL